MIDEKKIVSCYINYEGKKMTFQKCLNKMNHDENGFFSPHQKISQ